MLNNKSRYSNKLMKILNEKTFLFVRCVITDALRYWHIDLLICNIDYVFETLSYEIVVVLKMVWIVKYAFTRDWSYSGFYGSVSNIVRPHHTCQTSSRFTTDNNLSWVRKESNFFLQTLKSFDCDVMTSKIK